MRDEVENVGRPKNQLETQHRYEKANYDQIALRFRKIDKIVPLLNIATKITGRTKNEYVKQALLTQFKTDGITIDQLPASPATPQPEPKQPKRYVIYMITENWLQRNSTVESFVTSFATLNMARKYVQDKFNKKAYPKDWLYAIRGRYIEADNKANALFKMRGIIKEALDKYDEAPRFGDGKQSTAFYIDYISKLNPTVYCEHITCDGNGLEYTEIKENLDSLKENYPYEDADFEEIDLEDIVDEEES